MDSESMKFERELWRQVFSDYLEAMARQTRGFDVDAAAAEANLAVAHYRKAFGGGK